ncbi:MAG: hypothetical protein H0U74_18335 [Bradymonadaceae bacterium]|nr:hypothetical protein [Lujinxingiaceae bacterium]
MHLSRRLLLLGLAISLTNCSSCAGPTPSLGPADGQGGLRAVSVKHQGTFTDDVHVAPGHLVVMWESLRGWGYRWQGEAPIAWERKEGGQLLVNGKLVGVDLGAADANDLRELVAKQAGQLSVFLCDAEITPAQSAAIKALAAKEVVVRCASPCNPKSLAGLGEKLHGLDLNTLSIEEARAYAGFARIENLRLSEREVDLAALSELPDLRTLDLRGATAIRGVEHLAALRKLEALTFPELPIGEAALRHVAKLTQLRLLDVPSLEAGDSALAQLAGLTKLEKLRLGGGAYGEAGASHLVKLTRLRWLSLSATTLGDAGIAHLSQLTKLEVLWLWNTGIGDAGLAHLAKLANLRTLNVSDTQIADAGLAQLAGLGALRNLDVSGTSLTDKSVNALSKLSTITWVNLANTQLSDGAIATLRERLPNAMVVGNEQAELSDDF